MSTDGDSGSRHEGDPFASATPIELGTSAQGVLDRADDYFVIDVPASGVLEVLIEAPLAGDVNIHIYNAARALLADQLVGGEEDAALLPLWVMEGRHYIRVAYDLDAAETPAPFTLTAELDRTDRHEPNDDISDATPVTLGESIAATLRSPDDVDHFRVVVARDGVLEVKLDDVPVDTELRVRSYDHDMVQIAEYRTPGALRPFTAPVMSRAGTHYIVLSAPDEAVPRRAPYTLTVRRDPTDPHELNNDFSEATDIDLGVDVLGALRPRGDVDYFAFEVDQTSAAQLHLDPTGAAIDLTATFYDEDRAALMTHTASHATLRPSEPLVLDAGRHYLAVRALRPDDSGHGPYTLRIEVDAGALGEPDDTFADASPIAIGHPASGTIGLPGDVDTYWFGVVGQGSLYVDFTHVPANMRLVATFFDEDESYIKSYYGGVEGAPWEFLMPVQPGLHYLQIRSVSDSAFSLDEYTLTMTWEPWSTRRTAMCPTMTSAR